MENSDNYMETARDGYGSSGVDCHAALGLIALLGLIEILRDLIEDVTDPPAPAPAPAPPGRRRRSLTNKYLNYFHSSLLERIKHEFPKDIQDSFSGIVLPLLHSLVDINNDILPPSCYEVAFCHANSALVFPSRLESYEHLSEKNDAPPSFKESMKKQIGSLLTEVLAKEFVIHYSKDKYKKALIAGEIGRNGSKCEKVYKQCVLNEHYKPQPHFKIKHLKTFLGDT